MKLISTSEDNRRQDQVEEELIVESDGIQHRLHRRQPQDQTNNHARKDGNDRLVHRLDLLGAQDIAGEEGEDEQGDEDQQRPGGVDFFLSRFLVFIVVGIRGLTGGEGGDFEGAARYVLVGEEAHVGWVGGLSHAGGRRWWWWGWW